MPSLDLFHAVVLAVTHGGNEPQIPRADVIPVPSTSSRAASQGAAQNAVG
jgi:hypothetical protein